MKTLSNFLIMSISALFLVPKVIYTPTKDVAKFEEVTPYEEPYQLRKNKQEIELIKSDIRIILKEFELKQTKSK